MLQVNPPTVQIMSDQSGGLQDPNESWNDVTTQVGLLRSSSLAEDVAKDMNLANDPRFVPQGGDITQRIRAAANKVQNGLTVVPPDRGQLIKFSFVSDSPQLSARVANGLADSFINSDLQRRYGSSAYARSFLERQIKKTRGELENSERQLVAYARAQGLVDTSSSSMSSSSSSDSNNGSQSTQQSTSLEGEELTALHQALVEATTKRIAAEAAYRAAVGNSAASSASPAIQALMQSRATLQGEYQQKRTTLKPDHPEMVQLRSQIAELDKQIANEKSNAASAQASDLRAQYEAAAAEEAALRARVGNAKGQVLDERGRGIQYTILQRDVDTNRSLYDALLQRYKEVGVAAGIGTSPVSIVDHAEVPGSPFQPNLLKNLLVGIIGGFVLGVAAALLLDHLNDTITTRDDVRNKLGLGCLGTIPKVSTKAKIVDQLDDAGSAVSEAYSSVAASLGFSTESGDPKVLLVTSALPAEGKSSSALALAENFARRGRSVILIDADVRRPAFKPTSGEVGLTRLLTSTEQLSGHVSPTRFDGLWLLTAGPKPPNPADLLASARFRAVVNEAAAQFDMVIIDAPPVLAFADSLLIASMCNETMLVIESGKTRTSSAREAVQKLRSAGAHILGATLTKCAPGRSDAYSYGYRYGYGSNERELRGRTAIALFPAESDITS